MIVHMKCFLPYNNKESIIFLLAGEAADTAQKVEICFFFYLGFKQNVI